MQKVSARSIRGLVEFLSNGRTTTRFDKDVFLAKHYLRSNSTVIASLSVTSPLVNAQQVVLSCFRRGVSVEDVFRVVRELRGKDGNLLAKGDVARITADYCQWIGGNYDVIVNYLKIVPQSNAPLSGATHEILYGLGKACAGLTSLNAEFWMLGDVAVSLFEDNDLYDRVYELTDNSMLLRVTEEELFPLQPSDNDLEWVLGRLGFMKVEQVQGALELPSSVAVRRKGLSG